VAIIEQSSEHHTEADAISPSACRRGCIGMTSCPKTMN
jgi:hypothetical protein